MSVKINGRSVGPGHPCYFVAEIGINHNGSLGMALDLVRVAKEAGAEAVKFQKRTVPLVYQPKDLSAPRAVDKSIIDNAIRRQVIEGVRPCTQ
jgi:N-acetylneuraminate synthase